LELTADAIRRRLDEWPVARLATIGKHGIPHQVPIVFARIGECLWTPVDGKPKSGGELTRVRNIRDRPDVGILLDEYSPDWGRLWWIRIEGRGHVVRPNEPDQDRSFQAALEALRRKYPQYEEVQITRTPATLIRFDSLEIKSWCAR
jgi:PPOX class probable F420-dependent enzyme